MQHCNSAVRSSLHVCILIPVPLQLPALYDLYLPAKASIVTTFSSTCAATRLFVQWHREWELAEVPLRTHVLHGGGNPKTGRAGGLP